MSHSESRILELVEHLRNIDASLRTLSRQHLVAIGPDAVPAVARLLCDPLQHARWEAGKVLLGIASPAAVPALIEALGDADADVSCVAGEALGAIGEHAVP